MADAPNRVQVFVRVRPHLDREDGMDALAIDEDRNTVQLAAGAAGFDAAVASALGGGGAPKPGGGGAPKLGGGGGAPKPGGGGGAPKPAAFDGVLPPSAGQKECFERVALPVLADVMRGVNGCVLAYGQTGSGKTHSLQCADAADAGLLPRLVATLFVRAAIDGAHRYAVEAAAVQIYNEKLDDLVAAAEGADAKQLRVGEGGEIAGLRWRAVGSPDAALALFARCRQRLVYAETKMNKSSSRSHALFQLRVTRRPAASGAGGGAVRATVGRLTVADLAVSARSREKTARFALARRMRGARERLSLSLSLCPALPSFPVSRRAQSA